MVEKKNKVLQIENNGRPPSLKSCSLRLFPLTSYRSIKAKFGDTSRIICRHRSYDLNSKYRKLKMAYGRYFYMAIFCISAANRPIVMKFGVQMCISISVLRIQWRDWFFVSCCTITSPWHSTIFIV